MRIDCWATLLLIWKLGFVIDITCIVLKFVLGFFHGLKIVYRTLLMTVTNLILSRETYIIMFWINKTLCTCLSGFFLIIKSWLLVHSLVHLWVLILIYDWIMCTVLWYTTIIKARHILFVVLIPLQSLIRIWIVLITRFTMILSLLININKGLPSSTKCSFNL